MLQPSTQHGSIPRSLRPACLLLLLLPGCTDGADAGDETTIFAPARNLLAANPHVLVGGLVSTAGQGYQFTVSPDEAWLALLKREDPGASSRLWIVHTATGRLLSADVDDDPLGPVRRWQPNCFSAESDRVFYGDLAAPLAEGMDGLRFATDPNPPDLERFDGAGLGLSFPLRNRDGEAVAGWYELDQGEAQFGELAWDSAGETRYDGRVEGRVRQDFVWVTPPGERRGVDYGLVFRLHNEGRSRFTRADPESCPLELDQLAVSPDGRFLAGIANLYPSGFSIAPNRYGVVLPLDRGGIVAYPFASYTYGKIVWGRDSRSIYYYGSPVVAEESKPAISVHHVTLLSGRLPERLPVVEIPEDLLNAPSPGELASAAYEATKEAHLKHIRELFSSPQRLAEFERSVGLGYLECGHVIKLFGVQYLDKEARDATRDYVADRLLGADLVFKLPKDEHLFRGYIPGSRRGTFAGKDYEWPELDGDRFGEIPVLLYDGEGLVNTRFGTTRSLAPYDDEGEGR